jgi:hypothetical protein
MPLKFLLMSVFALMLLPFPLEAKQVDFFLVNDDVTTVSDDMPTGGKDWDKLDAVIQTDLNNIDYYFENGDLTLHPGQELIIRGGPGSIGSELDRYKQRKVFFNNSGNTLLGIFAYGCYVKRPIEKENTTYVFLSTDTIPTSLRAGQYKRCNKPSLLVNRYAIDFKSLSAKVKAMSKQ